MRYLEFKNRIQDMPVFTSRDLNIFGENRQVVRNQLRRWQNKGLLFKLRKGVYVLNKHDRKIEPSKFFIANEIYGPSYVSLEYALNFYGLIPERVADITSVSARKTKSFRNEFGVFIYRHIKKSCFTGFRTAQDEAGPPRRLVMAGLSYFIASPEKALVDFFYFNLASFKKDFPQIFEEGYRFQNVSELKKDKIMEFARLFGSKKLLMVCRRFCEFIEAAVA